MNKIITLAATTAIAGVTLMSTASAQQSRSASERDRPTVNQVERDRPTVSQLVAYDDARIARLKADLRLNKDQDGNWGKFEARSRTFPRSARRFVAGRMSARNVRIHRPGCRTYACDRLRSAPMLWQARRRPEELADASEPCWRARRHKSARRPSSFSNTRLRQCRLRMRRSSERRRTAGSGKDFRSRAGRAAEGVAVRR